MSEVPFRASIDSDGSVEIPKRMRKQLGLEAGDVLTLSILLSSGDAPSEEELERINEELSNEEE